MRFFFILVIVIALLCPGINSVCADNPFTSKSENHEKAHEPPFKSKFFIKIIIWQHQLKQKMSELIRVSQSEGSLKPLIFLMMIAFSYGAIHAVGPGHGKFIAMSYVLSRKASIFGGLMFGLFIAFFHGFSGAIGVIALRYIIQSSVSETLSNVTAATQIASFGLITLLGLGILLRSGYKIFFGSQDNNKASNPKSSKRGLLPWAVAVGLVPCPAVVMVMLFCMSMNALVLGLILAACITLGMAATISFAVTTVVMGKSGALSAVPEKHVKMIEAVIGLLSGALIVTFGTLFLLATINSTIY